jgi:prophage regulatory protein
MQRTRSTLHNRSVSFMSTNAALPHKNDPSSAALSPQSCASRLLPLEDIMTQCSMCRTTVYARIKAGTFPAPVKVGASSRWLSTEIDAWIAALVAARPSAGGHVGT